MKKHKRWWSLAVLLAVSVGAAWFVTGRRHADPEPIADLREEPRRAVPLHRFAPTLREAPEPVAEQAPADIVPVAVPVEYDDEPIPEGASQEEIEAKMAKARVAYAQPSQAAAEERNRHVAELVSSGAGGANWLGHFRDVENHWLEIDSQQGFGMELSDWECFKDGCTVTMRAPSVEALEEFSRLVRDGRTSQEWRGAGFRSGPIEGETGEVEATWIFYAPSG